MMCSVIVVCSTARTTKSKTNKKKGEAIMTNDMNDIKDNIEARTKVVGVCQDTKGYFSSRIQEATLTKKKKVQQI